jgi:ribA/ribD-fused uncharacterized protein
MLKKATKQSIQKGAVGATCDNPPLSEKVSIFLMAAVQSDKYLFFYEDDSPFSCFFLISPPPGEGPAFTSSEQYFAYQKAVVFGDDETGQRILAATTPGEAKALSGKVRNYDNDVWAARRYDVMVDAVRYKARVSREFREALQASLGKKLAKAGSADALWGVGIAPDDPAILDEPDWPGRNLLGEALMQVRQELFPDAA